MSIFERTGGGLPCGGGTAAHLAQIWRVVPSFGPGYGTRNGGNPPKTPAESRCNSAVFGSISAVLRRSICT
jgi:hypothetical protein